MPSSPITPGSTTNSASPEKICSSALTMSTFMVGAAIGSFQALLQLLRLLERLVDAADHVERLLGQRVALAFDDHAEAADRDDVAQLLVALQRRLHAARDRVVLLADDVGVDLARRRVERVDRRVDA